MQTYAEKVIGDGRVPLGDGPVQVQGVLPDCAHVVYPDPGLVQHQVFQDGDVGSVLVFPLAQEGAVVFMMKAAT